MSVEIDRKLDKLSCVIFKKLHISASAGNLKSGCVRTFSIVIPFLVLLKVLLVILMPFITSWRDQYSGTSRGGARGVRPLTGQKGKTHRRKKSRQDGQNKHPLPPHPPHPPSSRSSSASYNQIPSPGSTSTTGTMIARNV